MSQYLLKRLGLTIILLWLVATILFYFVHLLPGDPAMVVLGGGEQHQPTAEQLARVREQLGLEDPLMVQYSRYLGGLIRGDLGNSFVNQRPVTLDLRIRLTRSLQLIIPAMVLASLLGIFLGILAAGRRGKFSDFFFSGIALTGFSVPVFVSGNILVLIFAINLRVLPSAGYANLFEDPSRWLSYAILPIVSLSLAPLANVMRMTRTSMLEQFNQDYVRTVRAKGVSERVITYRHVLRNALLPVITLIGMQTGILFAGSVIVENVFNWPGLSTLLIRSIGSRDYPVIQGTVLLTSFLFILVNLVTDLSYAFINPKVRYK